GFVVGTFAFAFAFGGVQLTRVVAVPLVFLFFMVPPPPLIVYLMTSEMQLISSKLGVLFIRALNMPVFLTGNVIDLGTLKLEVVEACSGLRYLFPFLSLGFLMAYIFRGPLWQKAALFLITVPITVLMNSIRIAITAFMSDRFGADYAEGFSHFVEGWMIFVFCILFLLLTAFLISRVLNKRPLLAFLNVPSIGAVGPAADPKADQKQLIYLCLLIGLVTVSLFVRSPVLATPDRQRLLNLPYELDEWRFLNTETLSKETEEVLNADDYVVANFADEAGKLLNVYVAYLDSQEDGKSWHSPRQCLPGGGWQIGEITATALPIESRGQSISVNRALIQQGDERLLVYFWFEQRGRTITNEFMIKYYLMVDTVRKKRSDGALVRILTEVDPDETVDAAEQRLISFTKSVVDELPAYVPQ
ncbi:MAG: VPLPA-CTERM-specific exosortase XrtD, partial [Pseudomonadota bacterium]